MVEIRRDPVSVKAVIPVGIPEAIGAISIVVPVKTAEARADEETTATKSAATKVQASEAETSEMAAAEVEATEVTTSEVTATKVTATTEMPAAEVPPATKTAGACGLGLGDDGCNEHCEHDTQQLTTHDTLL